MKLIKSLTNYKSLKVGDEVYFKYVEPDEDEPANYPQIVGAGKIVYLDKSKIWIPGSATPEDEVYVVISPYDYKIHEVLEKYNPKGELVLSYSRSRHQYTLVKVSEKESKQILEGKLNVVKNN